jgi:hypothetical protein
MDIKCPSNVDMVTFEGQAPVNEWDRWSRLYCTLRARPCSGPPRIQAEPRCTSTVSSLHVARFQVNSDISDFDIVKSLVFATPQFVEITFGWSPLGMLGASVVPHWGFG